MKHTYLLSVLMLTGCASQIADVKSAVDRAPEWYAASREEISGHGYPNLSHAPQRIEFTDEVTVLALSKEEALAAKAAFENDPRSEGAVTTASEMQAWVRAMQDRMLAGGVPPTKQDSALFLDDEDLVRLQSVNAGHRH